MKSVWVADTHLGVKSHNQYWADLTEKLFDEIIDYCLHNDIDTVIHLGDFFDSRKSLNVLTINTAQKIINKFESNQIYLYIIRGNHDTFYKDSDTPHSLSFLQQNQYITIIDEEPYQLDNLTLVPWGYDVSKIQNKDTTLLGHFEINGFVTNSSGNEMQGAKLNKSDFKPFKQVYSGHFHTASKQGNITYIGSAFATSFSDINQQKGYYIYDEGALEFIEFTDAPKFISLTSEDEYDKQLVEGNVVRLIYTQDYGNVRNQQIMDNLYNANPVSVKVHYQISEEEEIVQDEEFDVNDNSMLVREYIDKSELPEHMNKEVLKKVVNQLEEGE